MKKTGTFFLLKDNVRLGIVLALLLPLLVFAIIYLSRFPYYPLNEFLGILAHESRLLTFFSAWALVGNIALFTLYINTSRYQTAKGVFGVTVVWGLLFLLLKVAL